MTTIVYRGGILAGDSCHNQEDSEGNSWCYRLANKLSVTKHVVYGTSGDADSPAFMQMLDRLKTPADFPAYKEREQFEGVRAIVCFKGGEVFSCEDGELSEFDGTADFAAIGSGRKFALGALLRDASAIEAVLTSSQICSHTRPPVYAFDVRKWEYLPESGKIFEWPSSA
jgi:hypothetical protein